MLDMGYIKVRLPVVMAEHRLKQNELAEAAQLRTATINALYNEKAKGIQWDTLAQLIEGLRKLTGRTYSVADLIEFVPDDAQLN